MSLVSFNIKIWLINGLTYNGDNHNHKIKNVPSYGEVVVSEGDQFQHTFSSKENNENHIYPIEDISHVWALSLFFYHHGYHVEADKNHNADIKSLVCY